MANQDTFEGMETEGAKMQQAAAKAAASKQLKRDLKQVNEFLYDLGRGTHDSVPLDVINDALTQMGFDELEAMILCGREGRLHEAVGRNKYLSLTWHKFESGRYEVVAYVN